VIEAELIEDYFRHILIHEKLYRERMDERSPTKMTRWVLNPGEKFDVRGYAKQGDEKYTPFEVLSEEESQKEEALNSSSSAPEIHADRSVGF